jgi:hypothetical protein
MAKLVMKTLAGIVVALCVGVLLYLAGPLRSYLRSGRYSSDSSARVMMITTTRACQCGLERCREVDKSLRQTLEQLDSKIALEVVDYAEETESAERLMEKFDVYMVPIVLVIDGDGEAVYRSEWNLDEETLRTKLGHLAE